MRIQWGMPHVQVSDAEKLRLLRYIDNRKPIELIFRSWELYEYPALPTTDKHVWTVKTSTNVNKPRYVILGFQTGKKNSITSDMSRFYHCGIYDLKVYLNSECFPYEILNIDIEKNKYAVLYDMYTRFQESYYHDRMSSASPLLSFE